MTSSRREVFVVSSLKGESAWSPMPEHLLSFKTDDDKSPFPDVGGINGDNEHVCEACAMKFKSKAQLVYHKAAFCFGEPVDEASWSPMPRHAEQTVLLPGESTVLHAQSGKRGSTRPLTAAVIDSGDVLTVDDVIDENGSIAGDGTVREKIKSEKNEKTRVTLPVWRKGADGKVPDFALKVDHVASVPLYVCLAHVRDERLPGTVVPLDNGATFAFDGEEYKGCEYDVITDIDGRLSWTRCEVVGGIPYNAVKGGYDRNKLQLFIARVTAPDGTMWVGKYVPHKLQCFYAWEGVEYTTSDFELLCLTMPTVSETGTYAGIKETSKDGNTELIKERTRYIAKEATMAIVGDVTSLARKRTNASAKDLTQEIAKESINQF
ncbi:hypothetical protein DPMN_166298 [Dreissena polymorpha]|uniref:Uncharacterized protein n=1 Tax=Dreissena polymorpha TaxID=45954 RepID=A0A9D4IU13_DREPO|nr:hypothetical protein DPMN_166298 [Dreissena polymorpha]